MVERYDLHYGDIQRRSDGLFVLLKDYQQLEVKVGILERELDRRSKRERPQRIRAEAAEGRVAYLAMKVEILERISGQRACYQIGCECRVPKKDLS